MNVRQLNHQYAVRNAQTIAARLKRLFSPPAPLIHNPSEPRFPLGNHNLYLGGAGRQVHGYINLDIVAMPGVDVAADAHFLPFQDGQFQSIEWDAVLKHVYNPQKVMVELERVLAAGGHLHIVAPFCHPFHEYPKDYRRFTLDGIKALSLNLEIVAEGWRTGPTATLLVFVLEYAKIWTENRHLRAVIHGLLGWMLSPLRYLDLLLFRSSRVAVLGNHFYIWLRKPTQLNYNAPANDQAAQAVPTRSCA